MDRSVFDVLRRVRLFGIRGNHLIDRVHHRSRVRRRGRFDGDCRGFRLDAGRIGVCTVVGRFVHHALGPSGENL
jgi:hypothetical protein